LLFYLLALYGVMSSCVIVWRVLLPKVEYPLLPAALRFLIALVSLRLLIFWDMACGFIRQVVWEDRCEGEKDDLQLQVK
jgi:hypothetical protein